MKNVRLRDDRAALQERVIRRHHGAAAVAGERYLGIRAGENNLKRTILLLHQRRVPVLHVVGTTQDGGYHSGPRLPAGLLPGRGSEASGAGTSAPVPCYPKQFAAWDRGICGCISFEDCPSRTRLPACPGTKGGS